MTGGGDSGDKLRQAMTSRDKHTGREHAAVTALTMPRVGVNPPSDKALHSSTQCAPACKLQSAFNSHERKVPLAQANQATR